MDKTKHHFILIRLFVYSFIIFGRSRFFFSRKIAGAPEPLPKRSSSRERIVPKRRVLSWVGLILLLLSVSFLSPKPARAALIDLEPCNMLQNLADFFLRDRHPLRPLPFNICKPEQETTQLNCNNSLKVVKTYSFPRGGAGCTPRNPLPGEQVICTAQVTEKIPITIDTSKLSFPVLGVTCPDLQDNTCYIDTIKDEKRSEYLNMYLGGVIQENEQAPLDMSKINVQKRLTNFGGVLKKMIPAQQLNEQKQALAQQGQLNQTYNQVVCYLKQDQVISRTEAQAIGFAGVIEKRLSDINQFINDHDRPPTPSEEPWYTCWLQSPLVQHDDLPGSITLENAAVELQFPHLLGAQQSSELIKNIFAPQNTETPVNENSSAICDVDQAISPNQPGDRITEANSITVNPSLTATATYSYRTLSLAQIELCQRTGIPCPTPADVNTEVAFPIKIKLKSPSQSKEIWQNMNYLYQALIPGPTKSNPVAVPLSADCGENCAVKTTGGKPAALAIPYLGGIYADNQTLQCALNPFKKCRLDLSPAVSAPGSCEVFQPYSSELQNVIEQARQKFPAGAVNRVPEKLLMAIYDIEGTIYWSGSQPYNCPDNTPGRGLMQIEGPTYKYVTDSNERIDTPPGQCGQVPNTLSRCNPVDAMELASRVLLWKAGQLIKSGTITTKNQAYNAACQYYGKGPDQGFAPDRLTNNLADRLSGIALPEDGQLSYCEYTCAQMNQCPPYPFPRGPQP